MKITRNGVTLEAWTPQKNYYYCEIKSEHNQEYFPITKETYNDLKQFLKGLPDE